MQILYSTIILKIVSFNIKVELRMGIEFVSLKVNALFILRFAHITFRYKFILLYNLVSTLNGGLVFLLLWINIINGQNSDH